MFQFSAACDALGKSCAIHLQRRQTNEPAAQISK